MIFNSLSNIKASPEFKLLIRLFLSCSTQRTRDRVMNVDGNDGIFGK